MDTWDKKITVGTKKVKKSKIRDYYHQLWNKDPRFRAHIKKKGLFVRAMYKGKPTIVRKGIKVKDWEDLESLIKDHAVEFHASKTEYPSYLDVDLPTNLISKRKSIARSLIRKLKKKKVNISMVTDSPSGFHIFSKTSKQKLNKALKDIEAKDKKILIGKSSSTKIVIDANQPNHAIPQSLSVRGKPYKKWNDEELRKL
jgi:hypothetical protein